MPESRAGVERLYREVGLSLRNKNAIGALQTLCGQVNVRLEQLRSSDFPKAWLLEALTLELLKYSIEDDYVNIEDLLPTASRAFSSLLESKDWIHPKLRRVVEVCRQVAEKNPITAQSVEVRIPTPNGTCEFLGRLAALEQPLIPVSSQRSLFVPILEDSLCHPRYASSVSEAFADRLARLREEEGVSSICLVEKSVGPVGALSMLSTLVRDLGIPASVYRAAHWPHRARLAGYQPTPSDRVALVYDLLVTGDGLRGAARDLIEKFETSVAAAVVLFGYGSPRETLDVAHGTVARIEALAWYDHLRDQLNDIVTRKLTRTENITVLSDARRSFRSPGHGRTTGPPPSKGGIPMGRSPRWSDSLGTYDNRELKALRFPSEAEIDRAIDLCWKDPHLRGVPHDTPDGITLIVPDEAVQYFKTRGLTFEVSDLLTPDDLPREELAEMRWK